MKANTLDKKTEPTAAKNVNQHTFTPKVDVCESTDEYHVEAEMPGVNQYNVDVKFEEGVLTILGRVLPDNFTTYKQIYSEYEVGNFERAFQVSDDVDVERIQASMKNGILKLTLPKKEALRPKSIEVKAE